MADPAPRRPPVPGEPLAVVGHLLAGRAVPFGPRGEPSAIAKRPVAGPIALGLEGLACDQQGDRRHHGGPEKALLHYAIDHYEAWRAELPEAAQRLDAPGAFGENVSTLGLTEAAICAGDVLRIGGALVQVSQGRQPCWKLNVRFGRRDMARRVQSSGRTGWYYRVIEPGAIAAGDAVALIDRPHPDWPVARLLGVLYRDTLDRDALEAMAAMPELAESWRDLAARRLETRAVESWTSRLETPPP